MKIGVMLPLRPPNDTTTTTWPNVRAMAELADQGGLDSVWFADHFLHRGPDGTTVGMHEAWTLLTAVGALTERVELGHLVLCASFRDPGLTAKMAATLDEISSGRLILGVGAGWHDPEYETFGLPTDHRGGRFEEWLEIVARLLRGETVSHDGTYHRVREAVLDPAPTRRIPLLVAGRRPRMMRLTGTWADAWNSAWHGPVTERVTEDLELLRTAVEAAGRPADAVETTVGLSYRDIDQLGPGDPDRKVLQGSVEELAEALRAYRDLGIAHAIVNPEPATPRSVERLAEAVRRLNG